MNILANFTSSIHFDCFSLQFWDLKFNGTAGIANWYLELKFEFISYEVMCIAAPAMPLRAFFIGLYFKPIIIVGLVKFDIGYQ